jgi:hypothetical protein
VDLVKVTCCFRTCTEVVLMVLFATAIGIVFCNKNNFECD